MSSYTVDQIPVEDRPEIDELPGDLSQLARVIEEVVPGRGVAVVLRLAQEYRSTGIYFHNLDALLRKRRDRQIIARYEAGEQVKDIARAVVLSERQVWKILGREPGEDKQLKLF